MTYIRNLGKFLDVMGVEAAVAAHTFALLDWQSDRQVDDFIIVHFTPPGTPRPKPDFGDLRGLYPPQPWEAQLRKPRPVGEVFPEPVDSPVRHLPRRQPYGGTTFDTGGVDTTGVRDQRPGWAMSDQAKTEWVESIWRERGRDERRGAERRRKSERREGERG